MLKSEVKPQPCCIPQARAYARLLAQHYRLGISSRLAVVPPAQEHNVQVVDCAVDGVLGTSDIPTELLVPLSLAS